MPNTLYRLLADDMCLCLSNPVRYIQDIEGEWQYFHCRLSLRHSCRQTRAEITIQILRAGIINHHLSSPLLAPAPGTDCLDKIQYGLQPQSVRCWRSLELASERGINSGNNGSSGQWSAFLLHPSQHFTRTIDVQTTVTNSAESLWSTDTFSGNT